MNASSGAGAKQITDDNNIWGEATDNPRNAAFNAVTIGSATQVSLRADITGSSGGSQGDPDGDILDADEDVTIRYNSTAKSIELVLPDGTSNTLANYISSFSLQYLDAGGTVTAVDNDVRLIRVTISGASTVANPRTHKTYGITVSSHRPRTRTNTRYRASSREPAPRQAALRRAESPDVASVVLDVRHRCPRQAPRNCRIDFRQFGQQSKVFDPLAPITGAQTQHAPRRR
jgi:hypothetical protein